MLTVRKSADRGRSTASWLDSRHSFSFADYHDPRHVHFGALRVLNEDWIQPASGFGLHPHRDMEILTWVLAGSLEHTDSQGHRVRLPAGHVQLMRAGTGIWHSETNPSPDEPLHLLQIWIVPDRHGLAPGHWEAAITQEPGRYVPLATQSGRDGGLALRQDASVYALHLDAGDRSTRDLAPGRRAWLQITGGRGSVGGVTVEAGDGVALENEPGIDVQADEPIEALLFDLA